MLGVDSSISERHTPLDFPNETMCAFMHNFVRKPALSTNSGCVTMILFVFFWITHNRYQDLIVITSLVKFRVMVKKRTSRLQDGEMTLG